ncbi:MAG: 1-deoxy-D-xylulose-5-phosphate reductoisomerase, partial [Alphaproteobacteria bacterium]|nr:1-deoxy-D-xylulose-5-phosphate reductoisomerase [Alphaproteobacteria bacterium]
LEAVRRGAIVALANKEVLVCAGALFMEEVRRHGATLLPVDSEHNAIFQVFEGKQREAIDRIVLTGSGGPFRELPFDAMGHVTPEQAIAHPNWSMGPKISVDSATMMNKGLELIEAHHLFGLPEAQIEVLINHQSIVHGMVVYRDGSVLAQLGTPDMRTPIAHTLAWPDRMAAPTPALDLAALGRLTFAAPDEIRFPALRLARAALRQGGSAPTILNAANEIAVGAFLDRTIGFLDIARIVERTLDRLGEGVIAALDDVHNFDKEARQLAATFVGHGSRARAI